MKWRLLCQTKVFFINFIKQEAYKYYIFSKGKPFKLKINDNASVRMEQPTACLLSNLNVGNSSKERDMFFHSTIL